MVAREYKFKSILNTQFILIFLEGNYYAPKHESNISYVWALDERTWNIKVRSNEFDIHPQLTETFQVQKSNWLWFSKGIFKQ